MTGPEHYAEAERLLRMARGMSAVQTYQTLSRAEVFAAAQVHATLALAYAARQQATGVSS